MADSPGGAEWLIALLPCSPSNRARWSLLMPSSLASPGRDHGVGAVSPASQRQTVVRSTPILSARLSWVWPAARRAAASPGRLTGLGLVVIRLGISLAILHVR